MDLTAMYLASPNYVKAIWSIAPFATIVVISHILRRPAREAGRGRAVLQPLLPEGIGHEAVTALTVLAEPAPDKEKGPSEEGPVKSGQV